MRKTLLALAAATLLLTGCAASAQDEALEAAAATPPVTVTNAYVKATDASSVMGDMFMTGAFMEITNNTDAPLTLVGGEADFAMEVQVHEVVDGKMQMKDGGFTIEPGATRVLKPGGDHMMFVGMTAGLAAGAEVTFTAVFLEGQTVDITAPVKVLNMGGETYDGAMASPTAMPSESAAVHGNM